MTLGELISQAGDRKLSKSFPKVDGLYVWDYKLQLGADTTLELQLIQSDSGKAGFRDKVSIQELLDYVLEESDPELPEDIIMNLKLEGTDGLTVARI